jgi:hypothetical protein
MWGKARRASWFVCREWTIYLPPRVVDERNGESVKWELERGTKILKYTINYLGSEPEIVTLRSPWLTAWVMYQA